MNQVVELLHGGIIVSCQPRTGSRMRGADVMAAVVLAAVSGGASGIRVEGATDIAIAKSTVDVPVIGLLKCLDEDGNQWITPLRRHAQEIAEAGADIIAVDATLRARPGSETPASMIRYVRSDLGKLAMADVDTVEAGVAAATAGADLVSTTLAGYVESEIAYNDGPDLEVLNGLVKHLTCPVIAEGRYSRPEHVVAALEIGAFAVVVGTAISDPEALTRRFVGAARSLPLSDRR